MNARDNRLAANRRRPPSGLFLVAGAAALWGTSGLTATVAYRRGLEPLAVSFARMAVGALVLFVLDHGSRTPASLSISERGRLLVIGAGLAVYQAGFFVAVERAGVSIATLVTLGLAPVLVTVAERLRTQQRAPLSTLVGIALALLGLVALVGLPADRETGIVVGAAFGALSAMGYAVMTLSGGPLGIRVGAERLTMLSFAIAAVLLAPAMMFAGLSSVQWDLRLIGSLLYLGVVPTAIAYRSFFAGLQLVPAPTAAMLALLEPLVATALAVPLLGERLSLAGWLGATALLVAVGLVTRAHRMPDIAPGPRPANPH